MKFMTGLLAAFLMGAGVGGCATPLDQREELYRTFPDALSACRQQQPNRHGQKYRLPPTHSRIAECLKRHGWRTDGTQIDSGVGT